MTRTRPHRASVRIDRPEDGKLDMCSIHVFTEDGSELTGQEVLDAVADALVLYWENSPLATPEPPPQYDA